MSMFCHNFISWAWETILLIVVVAQSFSRVWLFATPWAAACQVSLSSPLFRASANSYPSNHLILCHPFSSCLQSFPASRSFLMSLFFVSGDQSFGGLASSSVLPMNIQDWFLLGWTGWNSLQSKGFSRVFSNTIAQKHQLFSDGLSWQSNVSAFEYAI